MKLETAEKLVEHHVLASPLKNIGGLTLALLWAASCFVIPNIDILAEKYGNSTFGALFVFAFCIFWGVCPLLVGWKYFIGVWGMLPGFRGTAYLVVLILGVVLVFALTVAYIAGLVTMVLIGVLRPLFTVIAMAVYNNRVSKIIALAGDLAPYLEDDKFLKRVDNMSDSIELFREIGWISQAKYEGFASRYAEFAAFLEFKENYEAGRMQAV